MLLVAGASLAFLCCLGTGWFFFRRMLLPQAKANLPPSGADPWSRTRAPDRDGGRNEATQMDMQRLNGNGVHGYNGSGQQYGTVPAGNGFRPPDHGFAPTSPDYAAANPGLPAGGYALQGMQGSSLAGGFPSFSDGFLPPAQQMFPQGDASMIPPGSGAFPVVNGDAGFPPASSAFSAMYGMSGDPFSASQIGRANWTQQPSGSGAGQQTPPATGPGSDAVSVLSDPYLAEIIRQYSEKSKAVHPPKTPRPEAQPGFQNPGWLQ